MLLVLAVLAAASSPIPPASRQVVLSVSASWDATDARVRRYARVSVEAPWFPTGDAVSGSLGRTGLAWGKGLQSSGLEGPTKREGDGKSPAGVFDLRMATGYAPQAPPGTRLPYREATPTLRCVDDPRSRFYNRLVDEGEALRDWSSAEDMRRSDALYRLVVWVGHNDAPPAPDAGSCIFLHLRGAAGSVTEGCTAFDEAPLEGLLRWLDPEKRPVLVQLPEAVWRSRAAEWGLPRP